MKKLALALAFVASTSYAAFVDGNKLLERMQSEGDIGAMNAIGYVVGVIDVLDEIAFCLPSGVTSGQMRDVVLAYLIRNPQSRHHAGSVLVLEALQRQYPCAKGGGV